MSAIASKSRLWFTAEDLEQFPSDLRVELVRGEIRKMPPPPGEAHGNTTARLAYHLTAFIYENDLGETYAAETGFQIERDPDTVIGPDFAFVAKDRLPETLMERHLLLAPDLVVETRSPSDSRRRVDHKISQWLSAGVRMALELDPQARVLTVHRPGVEPRALGVEDTLSGEDVLPGFALPVRRLFRDLA